MSCASATRKGSGCCSRGGCSRCCRSWSAPPVAAPAAANPATDGEFGKLGPPRSGLPRPASSKTMAAPSALPRSSRCSSAVRSSTLLRRTAPTHVKLHQVPPMLVQLRCSRSSSRGAMAQ
eukprot:5608229-Prymnesium_polylepis.2